MDRLFLRNLNNTSNNIFFDYTTIGSPIRESVDINTVVTDIAKNGKKFDNYNIELTKIHQIDLMDHLPNHTGFQTCAWTQGATVDDEGNIYMVNCGYSSTSASFPSKYSKIIKISKDGSIHSSEDIIIDHGNCLTYGYWAIDNDFDKKWIIATGNSYGEPFTGTVLERASKYIYKIDPNTLEVVDSIELPNPYASLMDSGSDLTTTSTIRFAGIVSGTYNSTVGPTEIDFYKNDVSRVNSEYSEEINPVATNGGGCWCGDYLLINRSRNNNNDWYDYTNYLFIYNTELDNLEQIAYINIDAPIEGNEGVAVGNGVDKENSPEERIYENDVTSPESEDIFIMNNKLYMTFSTFKYGYVYRIDFYEKTN